MYGTMAGSGCCDGRSCPICTWCFHRCSARIPTILIYCRPLFSPSAVWVTSKSPFGVFWTMFLGLPKNKQKQTNGSTCFGPREKSGREKNFPGLVQIESTAHRWFWICTRTRNFFSRPDFFEGIKQVESIIPVFLKGEIRSFGCSLLFSGVPRPTIHG